MKADGFHSNMNDTAGVVPDDDTSCGRFWFPSYVQFKLRGLGLRVSRSILGDTPVKSMKSCSPRTRA